MSDKLEHCAKCGKHTICETGKGFMIGEKFFCWFCSTEELRMEEERND